MLGSNFMHYRLMFMMGTSININIFTALMCLHTVPGTYLNQKTKYPNIIKLEFLMSNIISGGITNNV